jgi:glucose-6-phosphate isomerase
MTKDKTPLAKLASWQALITHYPKTMDIHLSELFANHPKRGECMVEEEVCIYFDYSDHRITDETLKLLLQLAEESELKAHIDSMFRGDKINVTEKRLAPETLCKLVI